MSRPEPPRIIYDLGANNGEDLRYYLLKADKVVAVEANPVLAEVIRSRFADEIAQGRVAVENCALSDDSSVNQISFYVHRTQDGLSQLPRPAAEVIAEFDEITVPAARIAEIVARHGAPHYVKIDLEGYDHVVLKDLFGAGIFPPYVSAEAHRIEVFCVLVAMGGYGAFKLVRSQFFEDRFASTTVATAQGPRRFDFELMHMTGPYGDDLPGHWMDPVLFQRYLGHVGPGWIDIHASRVDPPAGHRVRATAEIAASLLYQVGMRLNSSWMMRKSQQIWGAA